MRRGSLRHYSSHGRRSGIAWDTAIGFAVGAILLNFLGLYLTHRALIATFEPFEPPEREERVHTFKLYPNSEFGEPIPLSDDGKGERPDDDTSPGGLDPSEDPNATKTPDPGATRQPRSTDPDAPGRPDAVGSGDQPGVGDDLGDDADLDDGPGDDDLVTAPDGQLPSSGDARGGSYGTPDPLSGLAGSTSALDQTFGRPPPQRDRSRDDDEGVSEVLVNRQNLYGSFFNRMRDSLYEHWRPQKTIDSADPHGEKYGDADRTTVLRVRIDANGKIVKIAVAQSSGFPELDQEAVRTMRAAAPFPNPPSGLADADGNIDFPFGFTVTKGAKPWIFRYRP